MSWSREFASDIDCHAPIGPLTWFKVGGRAEYLFSPRDVEQLAALVLRTQDESVPLKVLGAGANVLVRDDGVDGVVVRLDRPAFRGVKWHGTTADVGAGVDIMPFTRDCSSRGRAGLECVAGIPGTVGGAVRMNAGGRFGELGRAVRCVDLLRRDGVVETRSGDLMEFGYRRSGLTDEIVLAARLEFTEDDPDRVRQAFDECFEYKRRSQPLKNNSAGCIFKNPAGRSAGELIDKAGLKGVTCGRAHVSKQHANFIITESGATASDVLRLIDLIRERVRQLFNIELELEVEVW